MTTNLSKIRGKAKRRIGKLIKTFKRAFFFGGGGGNGVANKQMNLKTMTWVHIL